MKFRITIIKFLRVDSNQVDSSIVKTFSNFLNTQSQFKLNPVKGNPNLFINNPTTNPQQVLIKGLTMNFQIGFTYNISDPDLSYFITNTQIDREIQNVRLSHSFLHNLKYDISYRD